jgi:hypothetical protein
MKYWEAIADNLSKAGRSLGYVNPSALSCTRKSESLKLR